MNAPDPRSTTNERAAQLQERLNAIESDAARTTGKQPAATGREWARLQQRLHTDQRRHRRTRVGLISAAAACALVAAGLSWSHLNGSGPSVRVVPATVPSQTTHTDADADANTDTDTQRPLDASLQGEIIVASHNDRDHMAAALQGPLSRVGSCIGVRDTLIVWPAGTTWDASTATLTLADGSTSQLGAEMQIGGGTWRAAQVADLSPQAAQALTDCGASLDQDIWIT
jgi:hypothetical protein